eukprot:1193464-Rhodomonas_salina.1
MKWPSHTQIRHRDTALGIAAHSSASAHADSALVHTEFGIGTPHSTLAHRIRHWDTEFGIDTLEGESLYKCLATPQLEEVYTEAHRRNLSHVP